MHVKLFDKTGTSCPVLTRLKKFAKVQIANTCPEPFQHCFTSIHLLEFYPEHSPISTSFSSQSFFFFLSEVLSPANPHQPALWTAFEFTRYCLSLHLCDKNSNGARLFFCLFYYSFSTCARARVFNTQAYPETCFQT